MPDRLVIHDTHLRVRGPAAGDLFLLFTERWFEHPEVKALTPAPTAIPQPLPSKDVLETRFVQVSRTYGNGAAHPGIDVDSQGNPKGYGFSPIGAREIEAMTLHAIQRAKTFIYLEDQYLVSPTVSAALASAMSRLTFVLVLMCPTKNVNAELKQPVDVSQYRRRRQAFLEPILAAGPNKLFVFHGYGTTWMHSKLWIVDDKLALVGSPNVNNRGYTHDSEVMCSVFDPNPAKKWFFAHEMRMHLWAKHLGGSPIEFRDPIFSLARWKNLPKGHAIAQSSWQSKDDAIVPSDDLDSGGFGSDFAWRTGVDPDGG
jgi:phosphatidylserine/phosphatidylglycerophosphate/cardiolipin synthase-like enzyme